MGEIYRKARRVLIWLGTEKDGSEDTTKAFDCMDLLIRRIWSRMDEFKSWVDVGKHVSSSQTGSLSKNMEKITAQFNIPAPSSIEFKSLNQLLRRPWFTRAWTLQESYNARDRIFHCGKYEIGGEALERVVLMVIQLSNCTSDEGYMHLEGFRCISIVLGTEFYKSIKFVTDTAATLWLLLTHRRGSGCKDPRDLIFTLVEIATAGAIIEIDYSLSLENVFADTTAQIIMHTGHLSILGEVYQATGPTSLPSWVPDWRLTWSSQGAHQQVSSSPIKTNAYSSTGSSKALLELSECSKEITLQGIYWDEIVTMTDCSPPNQHDWRQKEEPQMLAFREWYEVTGKALHTAVLRTQCRDLKVFDSRQKVMRWDSDNYPVLDNVLFQHKEIKDGRRLAITRNFYIGFLPAQAKSGDAIAFLLGGEVPVILRRDPEDGKYTFVGECYMHGFMDGEALIEARRQAQPDYDHSDTSWLDRLHEEDFPFQTTASTIK